MNSEPKSSVARLIDGYVMKKLRESSEEWTPITSFEVIDFVKTKGEKTTQQRVFYRMGLLEKDGIVQKKRDRFSRVPLFKLTPLYFELYGG